VVLAWQQEARDGVGDPLVHQVAGGVE